MQIQDRGVKFPWLFSGICRELEGEIGVACLFESRAAVVYGIRVCAVHVCLQMVLTWKLKAKLNAVL